MSLTPPSSTEGFFVICLFNEHIRGICLNFLKKSTYLKKGVNSKKNFWKKKLTKNGIIIKFQL